MNENLLNKIIVENFPSLERDMRIQIQEDQRIPSKKRSSPMYIVIKLSKVKDKERILKTLREKWQITSKGDFSNGNPTAQKRVILREKRLPIKNTTFSKGAL